MWRKGNPSALLVGMQTGAFTVESSVEIPQKLKMDPPSDPEIPFLGIHIWRTQNTNSKEHKHPYVHCSVIYNCHDVEAAQGPSVDEWIKQLWDIYTMKYYLAVNKKEQNFTLWDRMDGPGQHFGKWNKPVRERQIPYNFIYMWDLMKKLN